MASGFTAAQTDTCPYQRCTTRGLSLVGPRKNWHPAAEISRPTIKRLQAGEGGLAGGRSTAQKIQAALECTGIEFIDENGGGPSVRLSKRQRKKKRF